MTRNKRKESRGMYMRIRHTYYEKPMASPLVFHSRAAYSWRCKIVTLSEETGRRMRNMDEYHTVEERKEVLCKFLKKMADSGYGPPTREEILKSGIRKYYRKVSDQETGGPRLYRGPEEMKENRRFKDLLTKRWFRPRRGGESERVKKELPWADRERRKEVENIERNRKEIEKKERMRSRRKVGKTSQMKV